MDNGKDKHLYMSYRKFTHTYLNIDIYTRQHFEGKRFSSPEIVDIWAPNELNKRKHTPPKVPVLEII